MDPLLYNLDNRERMYPILDPGRTRFNRVSRDTSYRIEKTLEILDSMHIIEPWFSELNKVMGYKTIEDLIRYMIHNRLYGSGIIDRSFIWSETEQGHGFWNEKNKFFNIKWDKSGIDNIYFDFI